MSRRGSIFIVIIIRIKRRPCGLIFIKKKLGKKLEIKI